MIVLGGIEYMSTDAISGKSEGKERITPCTCIIPDTQYDQPEPGKFAFGD